MTTQRPDGRAPHEKRTLKLTPNFTKYAEGSVLIEIGDTRVLCTATVDNKVPPHLRDKAQGWVTAEYAMLPRSSAQRITREVNKGHVGGRTYEIQRLIGRTLRAVVEMRRLGERTITIDCDVLQADGGTRTAAITGGFIALAQAVRKLQTEGTVGPGVLLDYVAATSVGIWGGVPILDLNYEEDSNAEVDMNIIMTGAGKFVELQGTAEKGSFDDQELAELLKLGRAGINELVAAQKELVGPLT
ncbi:MAG: ribonuclease PH [Candidatus Sumerlaeaceae bacterium]|nr:ribonuclease PH [Candidatus Sumerlaeaceae bacterium]